MLPVWQYYSWSSHFSPSKIIFQEGHNYSANGFTWFKVALGQTRLVNGNSIKSYSIMGVCPLLVYLCPKVITWMCDTLDNIRKFVNYTNNWK
jgi:hypothetical protein